MGVSRGSVINAEKGQITLENLIALLRALNVADPLNAIFPEQPISPIQLAKLEGHKRQRASGVISTVVGVNEESPW